MKGGIKKKKERMDSKEREWKKRAENAVYCCVQLDFVCLTIAVPIYFKHLLVKN
jgi:hypothetical protein